ncbi:hypothetical protein [Amycolatopsis albispora]|uniref:hypothetical protein n=1 Tax=Amycolatopsis albispora TaxID=1804986 RepID=UPI001F30B6B8|nr:hypothetical protein [Amycolatopsis albispora]
MHSTIARGRITAIDTAAALAVPGVLTVLTHENAPPMKKPPKPTPLNLASLASGTRVNYLNTDEVFWNGQPIAVVVATRSKGAREAASLVRAEYAVAKSTVDFKAAQETPNPSRTA